MTPHTILRLFAFFLALLSASSTFARTTTATHREWMGDAEFRYGLALSPLSPYTVNEGGGFKKTNTDTLRFKSSAARPIWQSCQWWSRYDLAHHPPRHTAAGLTYRNAGKSVSLDRHGILTLEIRTDREYLHPRRDGEQWPHLLIQQDFPQPLPLNDPTLERLILSYRMQLAYCVNHMKPEEYNPSFHTAQSPFYLYIRNTNRASADYGLCLWVGIQSFDYRYERLSEEPVVSWDIGTQMYIYQLPPRKLWGDIRFTDRRWHRLQVDLLPYIDEAFRVLHEKGLFVHSSREDFVITGMNFGWEVPGTFNAALRVKGFSLRSYHRK